MKRERKKKSRTKGSTKTRLLFDRITKYFLVLELLYMEQEHFCVLLLFAFPTLTLTIEVPGTFCKSHQ